MSFDPSTFTYDIKKIPNNSSLQNGLQISTKINPVTVRKLRFLPLINVSLTSKYFQNNSDNYDRFLKDFENLCLH